MGKMNSATLRLVLLISCGHALVHIYETSFGSVEQLASADSRFGVASADQKEVSGQLGNAMRLPFGLFALAAGWLADRYGARRLLLAYLFGCSGAAVLIWLAPNLLLFYVAMFALGTFASIYHPSGVGFISHHTTPENRTMALGYHGIFGSAGIAAGPILVGLALNSGASWRQYYLLLSIPGVLLAMLLMWRLTDGRPRARNAAPADAALRDDDDDVSWRSYYTLIALASLGGFVYAAILNFMPRYLDGAGLSVAAIPKESVRNYLTGGVLLLGVIGQYSAGRLARPATLEPLLALAFFSAAPFVLWMAFAQGASRLWAAGLFAPLFFMHQPLYNTLVAKYVPRRRRSLCYGLSFSLSFGLGSFGPTFAGYAKSDLVNFGTLSALLVLAGAMSLLLWAWHRRRGQESLECGDSSPLS